MSSGYSVSEYLLDRADIQDLIAKMYLKADQKDFTGLYPEVFADEIKMDYTDLLGGEPFTTTGQRQQSAWEAQLDAYPSTQHSVSGVIANLPRPGSTETRPITTTSVANIAATLVSANGTIAQNGGRLELALSRSSSNKGCGSWVVTEMKAIKCWVKGEFEPSALQQRAD